MLLEEEEKDKRLKLHALLMWRSACFYGAGGPKSNEQKKKKKSQQVFCFLFFSPVLITLQETTLPKQVKHFSNC